MKARKDGSSGRGPVAILSGALLLAGCVSTPPEPGDLYDVPLKPVEYVDLDRYMGRWYLIANIPYFAERGHVRPFVQYSRRPDGYIDDLYTAQEAFHLPPFTKDGLIEVTNLITNAEGRITFLSALWQEYAVLYLDRDYRYTVIGHPSRDYCWLFAREPRVPEEIYRDMLAVLAENRFDVTRVLKIPHEPDQVGAPGFQ